MLPTHDTLMLRQRAAEFRCRRAAEPPLRRRRAAESQRRAIYTPRDAA